MTTVRDLVAKLSSPDNKRVLEAVAELRARGWLSDGSLAGVPLCYCHLEGADLLGADLQGVDLHQAHLEWADAEPGQPERRQANARQPPGC
jgi:uncharacterized protein YjbI with pentapeptide repeats